MTLSLRGYQEQALEAEARHRAEHPDETRLAIVMATGLGKTIIMAERARRHVRTEHDRVLLLVHTDELAQQAEAKVRLVAEVPCNACRGSGMDEVQDLCNACLGNRISVGVVKADRDETDADIVIASVQTLLQPGRRERITDVGLVLVDECELYAAPQWQAILDHFGCFAAPCEHVGMSTSLDSLGGHCTDCMDTGLEYGGTRATPALGFTATLERGDGQGLGGIWQNVCFSRDISWGVRHGYLVQPIGHRLEIDPADIGHGERSIVDRWTTAPDTLDRQLVDALAPEKIVEKWLELAKGRPTIAFMPLVRSAESLCMAFLNAGVSAGVIWGDMNPAVRRSMLKGYEDGTFQVLVNAMVLTRGFDAPKTSCVIIGRPTRSRNLGIQMAGRGLRRAPDKQDCILIYVQDATTDLFTHADLSDKPVDRRAEGALTTLEDAWDLGKELDEANQARLWTGQVDAKQFDPLVTRSSKVWRATEHGTPYLPISKDGEYVFIVGTSVFVLEQVPFSGAPDDDGRPSIRARRLHKDLPDLELAMAIAEDEAQERGGDLGRLLADKDRAWRRGLPSEDMLMLAGRLGLDKPVFEILRSRPGGKAGKVSDLISKVQATRALEPMVKRIKEATNDAVGR